MLLEVKKCAENGNIKGLRYIFLDALDVDPTFEKYREDYEYCKKLEGFFETHQELSGLHQNEAGWNAGYWEQLKADLTKNFSEKRYAHMIRVAKVVYAGKIERLMQERARKLEENSRRVEAEQRAQIEQAEPERKAADSEMPHEAEGSVRPIQVNTRANVVIRENCGAVSKNEMEERRLAEARRKLEEENRRVEAEQRAQRERIDAARRTGNGGVRNKTEDSGSKKLLGIALAIVIIAVIVIILMLH